MAVSRIVELELERSDHPWRECYESRRPEHPRWQEEGGEISLDREKRRREGRVSSHGGSRPSGRQKCVLTSRRTRRLYPAADNIPVGRARAGAGMQRDPGTYIFFRGSPHK